MSVRNVGTLFPIGQRSFDMGEFTQEKGLMSAVNVGNLLSKDVT